LYKSKEVFEKSDDGFLPESLNNIGRLQTRQGKYQDAYKNLTAAYNMAKKKEGKLAMVGAKNALGNLYLEKSEPQNAINAFTESKNLAAVIGANEDLRDAYIGLTNAFKMAKDFSSAVQYQDSLISINKIIYDLEKNQKLDNLQLAWSIEKQEIDIERLTTDNKIQAQQIERAKLIRNFFIVAAALLLLLAGGAVDRYRYMSRTNKIITEEKDKSNKLLLNILPEETANELKEFGVVKARKYTQASVLFTDFVDFTGTASNMPPEDLVESINYYFSEFDNIVEKHNLEKIKTIGDAYMCAGGLPNENDTNIKDAVSAALEIIDFVNKTAQNPPKGITAFKIRIGIHSGPLIAGVVGNTKMQYDIWGDTVNIASRFETSSSPNKINVSEAIYSQLKDEMSFEFRGDQPVKNRGKMKMYFVQNGAAV
jgi:class 3 adenylate cyclase